MAIYKGTDGNDRYTGTSENDTITTYDGNDLVYGADGDDSIYNPANQDDFGDDTLYGGNGNDYINDGLNAGGNDRIYGDAGDDTIYTRFGEDKAYGGDGNDYMNDYNAGNDTFYGGTGNDTILTGTGDDSISGGAGNDLVYAGDGDDSIYAINGNATDGDGDDTLYGGAGNDYINDGFNANGNDHLYGGVGDDTIYTRLGNDVAYGGDGNDYIDDYNTGNDTLHGDAGNDYLRGRAGDDFLYGGVGDDTMVGDEGDDYMHLLDSDVAYGGLGDDTFAIGSQTADGSVITIDGAAGAEGDNDILDWTSGGWTMVEGSLNSAADADGNGRSGTVQFERGEATITVNFTDIENIVCFVRGTMIETDTGLRSVEDIRSGDLVMTKDHGLKPVSWIGSRQFSSEQIEENKKLTPIRIAADALGAGYPVQDLYVSPQHRILCKSRIAVRMFGEEEVLVKAKELVQLDGVDYVTGFDELEYFHIMFDQHEIVFANGSEAESLYTGPEALKALDADQLEEIMATFPELLDIAVSGVATPARPIVDGRIARKFAVRHKQSAKSVYNV